MFVLFSIVVVMSQTSLPVSLTSCLHHYIPSCFVGTEKDKKCFCLAALMDGKLRYLLFEGTVCIFDTFSARDEVSHHKINIVYS